jgi:asparagine synthase (glutamine-hydrolysing)
MCGISGVISEEISPNVKNRFPILFDNLAHRGPHGSQISEGSFVNSGKMNFVFGHHRLAVVDLDSRADQPLVSDKGSKLIINGEIYNSNQLRIKLIQSYNFKTTSDSEVALAVLEVYGLAGVAMLDGMFAFAFYPAGDSSIWLGRDRLGIKPLYFAKENDDVWFSSEAKPLAKALGRTLDEIGVNEWVQYQFQVSDRTFFNGISSVPPGHVLTIKDGRIKSREYWNIENHLAGNNLSKLSIDDATINLRDLLEKSVDHHLMADVEIASITSGGMDSSSVSALAASGVKAAFMGRYLEDGYDESEYARAVAHKANLDLQVIDISLEDFFGALPLVASSLDYPVAGPGAVGQFLVSKIIAKSHRVVLAGTGGDELFLGYTRDRFPLWASQKIANGEVIDTNQMPENAKGYEGLFDKFINGGGATSPISGFLASISRISGSNSLFSIPKHRNNAIEAELRAFISPSGGESPTEVHDSLLRYEIARFLPSLLHVEDRMSMAHGLESRVPLLDLALVEFVLSLPLHLRMSGTNPKDILRNSMSDLLPAEVVKRKDKMGFPVPIISWLKRDKSGQVEDLLNSLAGRELPGVSINLQNITKFQTHIDARELWGGLLLESWLRSLE